LGCGALCHWDVVPFMSLGCGALYLSSEHLLFSFSNRKWPHGADGARQRRLRLGPRRSSVRELLAPHAIRAGDEPREVDGVGRGRIQRVLDRAGAEPALDALQAGGGRRHLRSSMDSRKGRKEKVANNNNKKKKKGEMHSEIHVTGNNRKLTARSPQAHLLCVSESKSGKFVCARATLGRRIALDLKRVVGV
jgi:hypothetical protein